MLFHRFRFCSIHPEFDNITKHTDVLVFTNLRREDGIGICRFVKLGMLKQVQLFHHPSGKPPGLQHFVLGVVVVSVLAIAIEQILNRNRVGRFGLDQQLR